MRNMTNAVVHSCLHCHAGSWQAEASPRSLARTARSRPRSSRSAKPCGILLQHQQGLGLPPVPGRTGNILNPKKSSTLWQPPAAQ